METAGDIHRFNRDVSEALSRIAEKSAIVSSGDFGRDLKAVQSLIRKHEAFENDLVALEAQLQVLIDDSASLQTRYPEMKNVAQQQTTLLNSWNNLQDRVSERKTGLLSNNDYHSFLGMLRDLLAWSSGLRRSLITEEKVSDAASAQLLKTEHDNLKAEIETREKTFSEVVALGEAMVTENHAAKTEVKEKIDAVLTERQKLHTAWQHKKVYLDQLIDLHFYLRDVKQILTTFTSQEINLSNTECGETIEQVEANLKTHEAFQNLIGQQEEKVFSLQEHADKLIKQKHFDKENIRAKLVEVLEKRENIVTLCSHKLNLLKLNLLHAQFKQDASEEITWMEEKKRKLQHENKVDSCNLTEKIKLLQKHQVLQAEIDRHKPQITEVCTKGNRLVQKKHENSPEISSTLNTLSRMWEDLQQVSNMISKGLEEARDILNFNNEIDKIESWIRDKELLVSQADLGKDYEHCLELLKKLDDVDSDLKVDESRIVKINQMAEKLILEASSEKDIIEEKRSDIGAKYNTLQQSIQNYRKQLQIAGNVHKYQRDTDETLTRIKEKMVSIDSHDKGKDVKDVQEMSKRVDSVAEYMRGVDKRFQDHKNDAATLINNHPDMSETVSTKLSSLESIYSEASNKIQSARSDLGKAVEFHQFVSNCKDFQAWLLDFDKKVKSVTSPSTAAEADVFMTLHKERKTELNGRLITFAKLKHLGETLIKQQHPESENIATEVEKTKEIMDNVELSWEDTKQQLQQGHELFMFKEQHSRVISWIEEREAFLNNDDVGDSMSAVEALMRKHEGFVTTTDKQADVIADLEKKGEELLRNENYDADTITPMIKTSKSRLETIRDKSDQRLKKLLDSKDLHLFLRKVFDLKSWVKEKIQVALDESYYDSYNLQNKIQKHASFEAEISANKQRLSSVQNEGAELCEKSHFASQEIASQLEDLQVEWNHLLETSNFKKTRLSDADEALIFLHVVDEFDSWLDESEKVLESEDHGKDLNSVSKLLKKLQATEADVVGRKDTLKKLEDQFAKFESGNHFMLEELEQRFTSINSRYEALHEPVQIRRENLEDSLLLHQFNREVADETIWLEEKLPLAASSHLGSSLTEVQSLIQKHGTLQSEINSHDKAMQELLSKAEKMIHSHHFAAEDIAVTIKNLREGYSRLMELSSLRKLRLADSVESQQFFSKVHEVNDWIKEKEPIVKVTDIKNDEDSVQIYLKKVNDILVEADNQEQKVSELRISSERMIERKHFDSSNIQHKIQDLARTFDKFKQGLESQKQRLLDQEHAIEFLHEAEEVVDWINAQMAVAASEEYGKDVTHVERLIKTFDAFMQSIMSNEDRISKVIESGSSLLAANNFQHIIIAEKVEEITQLWEDLKELSSARHEALSGAKQVHVFDKNADETISWMGEKEAEMSTDETGQDLETIQSLIERQQVNTRF